MIHWLSLDRVYNMKGAPGTKPRDIGDFRNYLAKNSIGTVRASKKGIRGEFA